MPRNRPLPDPGRSHPGPTRRTPTTIEIGRAVPDPPSDLTPHVAATWRELAEAVEARGTFQSGFGPAFKLLVSVVAAASDPTAPATARTRAQTAAGKQLAAWGLIPAASATVPHAEPHDAERERAREALRQD